jgi:hypothetical protein
VLRMHHIALHRIAPHRIALHRIAFHRIPSHFIAFLRIARIASQRILLRMKTSLLISLLLKTYVDRYGSSRSQSTTAVCWCTAAEAYRAAVSFCSSPTSVACCSLLPLLLAFLLFLMHALNCACAGARLFYSGLENLGKPQLLQQLLVLRVLGAPEVDVISDNRRRPIAIRHCSDSGR